MNKSTRTLDGVPRLPADDERINATCRAALTGPAGVALMEYIKSITLMAVMPVGASDAELREREGMRRLAFILDARAKSKPQSEGTPE